MWHLIHESGDAENLPDHRMDLRFSVESDELRAAVVSRASGADLASSVYRASFADGTLELQLAAPSDEAQADMPVLQMRSPGDVLKGQWNVSGQPMSSRLATSAGKDYRYSPASNDEVKLRQDPSIESTAPNRL